MEDASEFFENQCASCHTIGGGPLTGPDLKNVTDRKDRAWLENFIVNPQAVISSGDPYALKLQKEARGMIMPKLPGVTKANVPKLMNFISNESKKEKSKFGGSQVDDRPFMMSDVQKGYDIFTGTTPLTNGGPACFSCHNVKGLPAFGGGRLGPELTQVYSTLGGKNAMAAWLSAPPSKTMEPIYKEYSLESEEIFSLLAYLKSEAERKHPAQQGTLLSFVFIGIIATGGLLAILDAIWRRRLQGVRAPMVKAASLKNRLTEDGHS